MPFDAETCRLILQNVERFCRERVRPRAAQIDHDGGFPRDLFTIFAKTDPDAGHKGISAFLVPAGTPGLTIGRPEELIGLRGSPIAELILDDVEIPAENLLGREGEGFRIAMLTLDESRLHC